MVRGLETHGANFICHREGTVFMRPVKFASEYDVEQRNGGAHDREHVPCRTGYWRVGHKELGMSTDPLGGK